MPNLALELLAAAESDPERAAFYFSDRVVTYGELASNTARMRAGFDAAGVRAGDRVALLCSADDFAESYLALLGIGAVAVPVNVIAPGAELKKAFDTTGAELAVADGPTASVAEAAGIATVEPGELRDSPAGMPPLELPSSMPAALLMTSGTTGDPRAAVLTHGSLLANLKQLSSHPGMRAQPLDVGLGLLPFFHIFGLNVVLSYALYTGTAVAFPSGMGAEPWLETIKEFGVTVVLGTPQLFSGWVALDPPADSFDTVRVAASGAAPLARETFDAFAEKFGRPLWEGYGLTEASPVVATTRMDPEPAPGSVGRPLPGVEVELRSGEGEPALEGDPGEIWVRGPNVFAGYWGDDEATAEVLVGGWLRTGDIATADEEGRLYLVDRSKDVVIVSGFNVFPAEVEEVLVLHPAVSEAAVTGRESDRTGEEVVAYVVASDPGADPAELREHCAGLLSRYKVPAEVIVVDELPHNAFGKVRRRLVG